MATTAAGPPAKKARHSAHSADLTHGKVIQGGTKPGKVAKALRKQLDAAADECAPWEVAFLFANNKGEYNGTEFGAPKTTDPAEFSESGIKACQLPDPTVEHQWSKDELKLFYNYCDEASVTYRRGGTVAIACVGGENRSKAMAFAVTHDPDLKPTCPALQAVAEAYINKQDPDSLSVPIYAPVTSSLRSRAKV